MYKVELEEDELKLIRKTLSDRSRDLSIEINNIDRLGKKLYDIATGDIDEEEAEKIIKLQELKCQNCGKCNKNNIEFDKDPNVIYTSDEGCEECCECKNEEDNYDRVKEYLSTKPIFDINYNKIYNSVNILPESQQMKYKYSAVTMKLFNVIDDILYTKDLKSPIIIVSNLNNLKFTMTPYFKGFPLSKYTDKEYMSGILTNPITNQEYQVFVSSKIDKEQVIIVNSDDIEWGYIR